jgi:hypothetical protein
MQIYLIYGTVARSSESWHARNWSSMHSPRVEERLEAYFKYPLPGYVKVLRSIKDGGGLSQAEICSIRTETPPIHASTMLRHIEST